MLCRIAPLVHGLFISRAASITSYCHHLRHLASSSSNPRPPLDSDDPQDADFSGRSEEGSDVLRTQLLDAALQHVKAHGWSHAALVAAAEDLKLSPAVTGMLQR